MKLFRAFFVACAGMLLLIGWTSSAHAWCNPGVVTCLTVIDSSNAQGHDDVNRYNCTGSTQFNGNAHVYRLDHLGGPLWINL
ncbi:hypothetical protein KJ815_00395, partial [bacterium]|nr:hypothetical protein [bacterium]